MFHFLMLVVMAIGHHMHILNGAMAMPGMAAPIHNSLPPGSVG
ncbi:MAG TPA: hypothetical protein VIN40_06050 [Candidatus Tyrphobacter sp.]